MKRQVSRVTGIPVGDLITHEHGDKNVATSTSSCCTHPGIPQAVSALLDGRLAVVTRYSWKVVDAQTFRR